MGKGVRVYCRNCDDKWDWDELEGPECPDCNRTICTKGLQTDAVEHSTSSSDSADQADEDDEKSWEEQYEDFYDSLAGPKNNPDVPYSREDPTAPLVPDVSDTNTSR